MKNVSFDTGTSRENLDDNFTRQDRQFFVGQREFTFLVWSFLLLIGIVNTPQSTRDVVRLKITVSHYFCIKRGRKENL